MEIFTLTQVNALLTQLWAQVSSNAVGILIILGAMLGIAIARSMLGESANYWRSPNTGRRYKL